MDPNGELRDFFERALVENIDSLEVVEKLMAIEETGDDDPDIGPPQMPVCEPVKPRPRLNSGGIAWPGPD